MTEFKHVEQISLTVISIILDITGHTLIELDDVLTPRVNGEIELNLNEEPPDPHKNVPLNLSGRYN